MSEHECVPADEQSRSLSRSADAGLGRRRSPAGRSRRTRNVVRVGVIGYGYWGPNIVRNLQGLENCAGRGGLRQEPGGAAPRARALYPDVHLTTDFAEVLQSPDIDAVAVVTPVWTHYELAKAALENGKHVFVEKPFTSTSQQAEELIELADRKNLKIMVDHTFLFSGAVQEDPRDRRRRDARAAVLLRLDAREPRALPARRQRGVGPRAARPVDHGPHHRREARKRSSRPAATT